jgi:hypothetical protein
MRPVLVTFLFIRSLVEQCKHKRIPPPSPSHLLVGGRAAANGSAARGKAAWVTWSLTADFVRYIRWIQMLQEVFRKFGLQRHGIFSGNRFHSRQEVNKQKTRVKCIHIINTMTRIRKKGLSLLTGTFLACMMEKWTPHSCGCLASELRVASEDTWILNSNSSMKCHCRTSRLVGRVLQV